MKWKFKYLDECNAVLAECEGRYTNDDVRQFREEGLKMCAEHQTNKAILDYRRIEFLLTPSRISQAPDDVVQIGGRKFFYAFVMEKTSPSYEQLELAAANIDVQNFLKGYTLVWELFENVQDAIEWIQNKSAIQLL